MREIQAELVVNRVSRMCQEANIIIAPRLADALKKASDREESPIGKAVLKQILENAVIAREERIPLCQDTGVAVFFVEWGEDTVITGSTLEEAINEGVKKGYTEGYLRKSMVEDPLRRSNTGDNTPAIIHIKPVAGDRLKITFLAKGGGSENQSKVGMLKPADGREGVVNFVVDHVKEAGPNPCPPIIVGVGIGGTFEYAAYLSKKALLRTMGEPHPDPYYAEMEEEILEKINNLGIGPQGFGGRVTALAVHILTYPCHIASLPVAVNIDCHASRHMKIVI